MADFSFPTHRALSNYKEYQWQIMMETFENIKKASTIGSLIEHFGEDGLYEQLLYHQKMIRTVCEFGSLDLLIDYLSLRYRLFITRNIDIGYFLLENHHWSIAIRHYLFEPYAAEILILYHHMDSLHHTLSHIDVSYRLSDTTIGQLTQALIDADEIRVRQIFHTHLDEYDSPLSFLDQLIKPAMILVGIAWERGEISVAKEHVATAIIERVWKTFASTFKHIQSTDHSALIITPESQLHKLGTTMLETYLESKGWKIAHIALKENDHDVYRAIDIYQPQLIVCSIMLPICIPMIQSFVTSLKKQEPIFHGKVIVGGQAFYRTDPPILLKDVDFQGSSLKELEAYIESFDTLQ